MKSLKNYHLSKRGTKPSKAALKNSWWMMLFIMTCLTSFQTLYKKMNQKTKHLEATLHSMQKTKSSLLEKKNTLSLKIKSLEDPKFVEMLLQKELGLIRDRQTKIFFSTP